MSLMVERASRKGPQFARYVGEFESRLSAFNKNGKDLYAEDFVTRGFDVLAFVPVLQFYGDIMDGYTFSIPVAYRAKMLLEYLVEDYDRETVRYVEAYVLLAIASRVLETERHIRPYIPLLEQTAIPEVMDYMWIPEETMHSHRDAAIVGSFVYYSMNTEMQWYVLDTVINDEKFFWSARWSPVIRCLQGYYIDEDEERIRVQMASELFTEIMEKGDEFSPFTRMAIALASANSNVACQELEKIEWLPTTIRNHITNCIETGAAMYPLPTAVCKGCARRVLGWRTCGKCKKAKYCSRKCQARHWKNSHKLECCTVVSV